MDDIKNKLLSVNKYYFANELYIDHFHMCNLIYDEFIKLFDSFKNNFDEKYIINIQIKVNDMISNEIIVYHNSKTQELMDLYNGILGKLSKGKIKNTKKWDLACYAVFGWIFTDEFKYSSWEFNFNDNFDVSEIPNYLKTSTAKIFSNFKLYLEFKF